MNFSITLKKNQLKCNEFEIVWRQKALLLFQKKTSNFFVHVDNIFVRLLNLHCTFDDLIIIVKFQITKSHFLLKVMVVAFSDILFWNVVILLCVFLLWNCLIIVLFIIKIADTKWSLLNISKEKKSLNQRKICILYIKSKLPEIHWQQNLT